MFLGERRNWFRSRLLRLRSVDNMDWHVFADSVERVAYHITALISFGDNPVSSVLVKGALIRPFWELPIPVGCSLSVERIGLEEIMTRSARISLAAALLLGGVAPAMAQNGPATGGYPPRTKNPNLYGYYGYYGYPGYDALPRYVPYYCRTPYYVLGYPVPHYGYMGWCGSR
jgi:hypothetical protein